MDYQEAVSFLDSLVNYERRPTANFARKEVTLERVRELADMLGGPQERFRSVHIAGTKGKGSTAAMVEAVLRAHGLRTGLYTSPHLVDPRERVRLGGRMIPKEEFAAFVERLRPFVEARRRDDERRATYFETFTHLAFLAFAEAEVDAAVVEVGMGGRLDATNIIRPVVCGITAIGLDHMRQLGEDTASIAREKAGILKDGVPVAAAPADPAAEAVIVRAAREKGCPVYLAGEDFRIASRGGGVFTVEIGFAGERFDGLSLPLPGRHQENNAALAVALACLFAEAVSLELDEDKVRRALEQVHWPGRIQRVSDIPPLYVDGAHNRDSLTALFETLRGLHPGRKLFIAFGCGADKDVEGMLSVLEETESEVCFTRSISPRAMAPEDLAAMKPGAPVADNAAKALEWLRREAADNDGVGVVCGSLYLAGEALAALGLGGGEEAEDERRSSKR